MSKIKCIIIEDEPLATKVLVDYISQVPFLQLQATFKDAILAADYLRHSPDDLDPLRERALYPELRSPLGW